jgi:alpha-L-arabinofuranosidase
MRRLQFLVVLSLLALTRPASSYDASPRVPIRVTINAAETGQPINPFIYGQFIEHLGRCIYGGIWAEMLEDRKFYFPITDKHDPYRGLKDTQFPVVGASPWQVLGPPGSVQMSNDAPFVGEHTPLVGAGSGIQQNDLGLVEGKRYTCRIRLRAPKGNSLVKVMLVSGDGRNREFSNVVAPKPDSYEQHEIRLASLATTDHGRLVIEVSKGPCLIGAVSLMPVDNLRGFRADTLALLKQLNSPIYRWPGGNFVSGYDWRDGIGPRDRRPPRKNPAWTGVESNDVGIDEFLDLCREIGTEPMIAVNTGFGDDYSAAQEVEYANGSEDATAGSWRVENGHEKPYRVKYWCVGNEMWGDWQLGHMKFDHYAQKHSRFVAAMRKVDPNIILVASGDLGTKVTLSNSDNKRESNWSQGMLERCADSMGFISEHFYKGNTPWGDKPPSELPLYVALLKDEIRNKAKLHRELQLRLGRKPDRFIPIAMDEWNYWHRGYKYGELGCEYSLADALGVAAGLHEYFRNTDIIHMANYAQTVNVIGCIKTTKTAAYFDTTALPLMLYRGVFGTVPLAVKGNHAERSIDVTAARTEDGAAITVGIINPQAQAETISLSVNGLLPKLSATAWRIAGKNPAATNSAEHQAVTIVEEQDVPFGESITVPPYSINVYKVPLIKQ